jgi:hypothetical protein
MFMRLVSIGGNPWRIQKLKRRYKERNKLLKQQGRPRINSDKKTLSPAEASSLESGVQEARNDLIGCLSIADEAGGNRHFPDQSSGVTCGICSPEEQHGAGKIFPSTSGTNIA